MLWLKHIYSITLKPYYNNLAGRDSSSVLQDDKKPKHSQKNEHFFPDTSYQQIVIYVFTAAMITSNSYLNQNPFGDGSKPYLVAFWGWKPPYSSRLFERLRLGVHRGPTRRGVNRLTTFRETTSRPRAQCRPQPSQYSLHLSRRPLGSRNLAVFQFFHFFPVDRNHIKPP